MLHVIMHCNSYDKNDREYIPHETFQNVCVFPLKSSYKITSKFKRFAVFIILSQKQHTCMKLHTEC